MKNKVVNTSLSLLFVLLFIECKPSAKEPQRAVERKKETITIEDRLSEANKVVAQNEETSINKYVERRRWPMQKMSNGLRIWEYEEGKGKQIDYDDRVTIDYRLEAINGQLIYEESKSFIVGKQDVELGLDQALRELKAGSKAKIIIPSHLGYGLIGDGNRIPKMAVLIYDIKEIKLN